jgi:hypothetical protein
MVLRQPRAAVRRGLVGGGERYGSRLQTLAYKKTATRMPSLVS